MSLIARTAGIGRSAAELQWDLNYMLKLWEAIDGAAKAGKGAFLIYQESSLVIRAIRDYFTADVGEILIDTDDIYDQALQFMSHVMPETASKVKRYRDDAPLFSRFQIEHQIETAFSRTVNLPSGGAIVIDHTEALVSVDVNSARSTRGSDIEETATRTNLEAADEIARQMRLRDLGGLIVVDFIDMEESKNRREVETRLRDALRQDRARVQFSSISKFGLLELSRQRLRPALSEGSHITCPRCNGTGHIRDTESSALQILRMVQEESMKENTAAVHVQVPVEVTSFLLNEKRTEITKIELKQRVTVLLVPNKNLDTPNYRLERLRHDDPRLENLQASYTMIDDVEDEVGFTRREKLKPKQEPVIKGIMPETPAPQPVPKPEPVAAAPVSAPAPVAAAPVAAPAAGTGFFGWIKKVFGGAETPVVDTQPIAKASAVADGAKRDAERGERGGRGGRGGRDGSRDGKRSDGREGPRAEGRTEGRAEGRGDGRGGRDGRGRRNERGERPEGDEVVKASAANAAGEARSDDRGPRPEGRGEARGDGRRGGRGERGERRPPAAAEGRDEAPGMAPNFVDTIPVAEPGDSTEAQGERGSRRRSRRGRGGRDRDESRGAESIAPADVNADAGANGLQAPNGEAIDVPKSARDDAPAGEGTPADLVPGATDGEDREGRRRGRGRDRPRRERRDETAPAGESTLAESGASTAQAFVPAQLELSEPPAVAQSGPAAAHHVADAPAVAGVPAPAPAPIASAAAHKPAASVIPTVAQFVLPSAELEALATSAGLQWVGSDAEKVRAVREAMAREPAPVHVPREPKPPVVIDAGPLVLVETRKDLSQITLPFDAQGAGAKAPL
jgi:ribonuclease E